MFHTRIYLFTFFIILLLSCKQSGKQVISCKQNPGTDSLFVFVGEKISVNEVLDTANTFDNQFTATYKVLERVCGDYGKDTITFTVYDHYGHPDFEHFNTVLLFVEKHHGRYYHEKYLYNNVYRAADGRWAGPYSIFDYGSGPSDSSSIKPEIIAFEKAVIFDVSGRKKHDIGRWYPKPYYRIEGDKAIAVYGNYLPELFELKKQGTLKGRGFYGVRDSLPEDRPKEVILEYAGSTHRLTKAMRSEVKHSFQQLLSALKYGDAAKVKAMSLDSVVCSVCEGFAEPDFYNDREPVDTFIAACNRNLPGTVLWKQLSTSQFTISTELNYAIDNKHPDSIIYQIVFPVKTRTPDYEYLHRHKFEFIRINEVLRFQGLSSDLSSSRRLKPYVKKKTSAD